MRSGDTKMQSRWYLRLVKVCGSEPLQATPPAGLVATGPLRNAL